MWGIYLPSESMANTRALFFEKRVIIPPVLGNFPFVRKNTRSLISMGVSSRCSGRFSIGTYVVAVVDAGFVPNDVIVAVDVSVECTR